MARRVSWFFARHWIFSGVLLIALAVMTAWLVFPAEAHNMVAKRWTGQYGGGRVESTEIIRTQEQWRQLWQRLDREVPAPLHPGEQIAVFLSSGEKPNTGYKLRLISTALRDDRLMIVWEAATPDIARASANHTGEAITQPWMIMLIDRADLAPVIEQRVR
jgi:hypothetical protein